MNQQSERLPQWTEGGSRYWGYLFAANSLKSLWCLGVFWKLKAEKSGILIRCRCANILANFLFRRNNGLETQAKKWVSLTEGKRGHLPRGSRASPSRWGARFQRQELLKEKWGTLKALTETSGLSWRAEWDGQAGKFCWWSLGPAAEMVIQETAAWSWRRSPLGQEEGREREREGWGRCRERKEGRAEKEADWLVG